MQEPCQEQEMYQRDNSQKDREKTRKRKKEMTERERGRERQREKPHGTHRGRPEAKVSTIRHTQMSLHKYVLGVYVERWIYVHVCICAGLCGSFEVEAVWAAQCKPRGSLTHLSMYRTYKREQNSPGDMTVAMLIMLCHRLRWSRQDLIDERWIDRQPYCAQKLNLIWTFEHIHCLFVEEDRKLILLCTFLLIVPGSLKVWHLA